MAVLLGEALFALAGLGVSALIHFEWTLGTLAGAGAAAGGAYGVYAAEKKQERHHRVQEARERGSLGRRDVAELEPWVLRWNTSALRPGEAERWNGMVGRPGEGGAVVFAAPGEGAEEARGEVVGLLVSRGGSGLAAELTPVQEPYHPATLRGGLQVFLPGHDRPVEATWIALRPEYRAALTMSSPPPLEPAAVDDAHVFRRIYDKTSPSTEPLTLAELRVLERMLGEELAPGTAWRG